MLFRSQSPELVEVTIAGGKWSSLSRAYIGNTMPNCRRLFVHKMARAVSLDIRKEGRSIAINIEMTVTTTSNSMRVKAGTRPLDSRLVSRENRKLSLVPIVAVNAMVSACFIAASLHSWLEKCGSTVRSRSIPIYTLYGKTFDQVYCKAFLA